MAKSTDVRVIGAQLWFLPVETRVPLKVRPRNPHRRHLRARGPHGAQIVDGQVAVGWGETPLSVQWVWPSALSYAQRHAALQALCLNLVADWAEFPVWGHALEVGHAFIEHALPQRAAQVSGESGARPALAGGAGVLLAL